jgi:hypothetical protein
VRANDGVHSSGLNFEPKNKFMFFKSKAMLGMQDYPDAKCKTLLETHDKKYFLDKYSALKQSYELLAQDNLYEVFNTNCLWATEKVLEDNNYKFPEEFYKILAKN